MFDRKPRQWRDGEVLYVTGDLSPWGIQTSDDDTSMWETILMTSINRIQRACVRSSGDTNSGIQGHPAALKGGRIEELLWARHFNRNWVVLELYSRVHKVEGEPAHPEENLAGKWHDLTAIKSEADGDPTVTASSGANDHRSLPDRWTFLTADLTAKESEGVADPAGIVTDKITPVSPLNLDDDSLVDKASSKKRKAGAKRRKAAQ
ncbi:hypothetical protein AAE478_004908 [Parahypoxylon ruwenzoriense]